MRFAWLRQNTESYVPVKQKFTNPLSLMRFAYNLVFWVFVLPFFTPIDYSTGFIAFAIVIGARFVANSYTNNVLDLTPAQYDAYPLRIP